MYMTSYTEMDMVCPVACGECCDAWRSVIDLSYQAKTYPPAPAECPYLTSTGCKLQRQDRPLQCTAYICELGILALANLVTKAEINNIIAGGNQQIAFAILKKHPKIKVSKIKFRKKDRLKILKYLNKCNT